MEFFTHLFTNLINVHVCTAISALAVYKLVCTREDSHSIEILQVMIDFIFVCIGHLCKAV